jgi:hypothetical protein
VWSAKIRDWRRHASILVSLAIQFPLQSGPLWRTALPIFRAVGLNFWTSGCLGVLANGSRINCSGNGNGKGVCIPVAGEDSTHDGWGVWGSVREWCVDECRRSGRRREKSRKVKERTKNSH